MNTDNDNMYKNLCDYHIHIGQFEEMYYNPYKVVESLAFCGVHNAYVSSTTSCIRWHTENEKRFIINHIKSELHELRYHSKLLKVNMKPLCWIIPERIIEGESFQEIMDENNYEGFKIHLRAQEWNLDNKKVCKLMSDICYYASKKNIPVLIHTGICDYEKPSRLLRWYLEYPDVIFILAHCKDIDGFIDVSSKCKNIYGDAAFLEKETFKYFVSRGLSEKILFGTDFPITNYMCGKKSNDINVLRNEYMKLLLEWKNFIPLMAR